VVVKLYAIISSLISSGRLRHPFAKADWVVCSDTTGTVVVDVIVVKLYWEAESASVMKLMRVEKSSSSSGVGLSVSLLRLSGAVLAFGANDMLMSVGGSSGVSIAQIHFAVNRSSISRIWETRAMFSASKSNRSFDLALDLLEAQFPKPLPYPRILPCLWLPIVAHQALTSKDHHREAALNA
jgi:hypothetical protein